MQRTDEMSFADLVEHYLGDVVSERFAACVQLHDSSSEFQQFVTRMLSLMASSGFAATDLTPFQLTELSNIIQKILPNAWGGKIPPLTFAGRHKKLDDYVASHSFNGDEEEKVFIDLGCGLPPITTVDTANRFIDWKVVGIDRSFSQDVVCHPDNHYACFDHEGHFEYFQPNFAIAEARELYANPQATREQFIAAYKKLRPQLTHNEATGSATVEKEGYRLIRNWIRDFETSNLTLIESEIGCKGLPTATAVRCMNVLVYLPIEERRRLMALAGSNLQNGGIMLWGTNAMNGSAARYGVAVREDDVLVPTQFALSLDTLLPIGVMPYFTLHEDDPEATLLAELRKTIRSDSQFWTAFSSRVDELLAQNELTHRGKDGFFEFPSKLRPPMEFMAKISTIWTQVINEGFCERAVKSLCSAEFDAFINQAGDIAIKPVARTFFEPTSLP